MITKPLTLLAAESGCSVKASPFELEQVLQHIKRDDQAFLDKRDAGTFFVNDELNFAQNIDVITPVSDIPEVFGEIAVEHSLSDLYAVGAKPITGMLFLGFPLADVEIGTVSRILAGALERFERANIKFLKGHTIISTQLQLGVAVTGIISSSPISHIGSRPGDSIILTKPLGNGIVTTALKFKNAGLISQNIDEMVKYSEKQMLISNSIASSIANQLGVNACTDVSGFGLIGHLYEMLHYDRLSAEINFEDIPLIPGVLNLVSQSIYSGASEKNAAYYWDSCEFNKLCHEEKLILFDAQTSGGLLITVSPDKEKALLAALKRNGIETYARIGIVTESSTRAIIILKK